MSNENNSIYLISATLTNFLSHFDLDLNGKSTNKVYGSVQKIVQV